MKLAACSKASFVGRIERSTVSDFHLPSSLTSFRERLAEIDEFAAPLLTE